MVLTQLRWTEGAVIFENDVVVVLANRSETLYQQRLRHKAVAGIADSYLGEEFVALSVDAVVAVTDKTGNARS